MRGVPDATGALPIATLRWKPGDGTREPAWV